MFDALKTKVQTQFRGMCNNELFVVQTEKNELFNAYLAALPETDRQEHNCNCCKSFLNHYGNIVIIKDNLIQTIWDFQIDGLYSDVPNALRDLILTKAIENPFLSKIDKLGTDFNRQRLESGEVIRWGHFYVALPKEMVNKSADSLDTILGNLRTTKEVFERSLNTITQEATETVLELIAQNILYRGREFETMLKNFYQHQLKYATLNNKDLYAWANYKDGGRIRNTAIGTLLIDLSEGMPLEQAVRKYEAIMAPANYKRPTALVTESMVKQAQAKLTELGLINSLKRRHATVDDIPVTNLLYVNRTKKNLSVFEEMAAETPVNPKSLRNAKELSLQEFIDSLLPTATSVEFLLGNNNNFVSLFAPEDADAPNMFAWSNPISWTYQNNLTDTIKEKVKEAGGSVTGELRISLAWFNYDDLDLHVIEPDGNKIYYSSKRSYRTEGFLDVDMNAGSGNSRKAVENITFPNKHKMLEGEYKVIVHNFAKRENRDMGCSIQIECQGNIINMDHTAPIPDRKEVLVATFIYKKEQGISNFRSTLPESHSQREINGVHTNRFQPVTMMMYSPNHWTDKIGNQHLFFILEGAKIDIPLRPFFNEYLSPSLQEHRKVFEILGSKLMVKPAEVQLSGVGFSLTQRNQVVVRVNSVPYKVNI